jgi:prepilin-type N-terminal cleavage/methylation domain-containing protein
MKKSYKKAFTLLEIVFVLVIIGIMAGVGSSSFRSNYLLDDASYISLKIKEAQFDGIGVEHLNFGGGVNNSIGDKGCIELEKSALENAGYTLHVDDFDEGIICFDSKGRPHEDDFDGDLLLSKKTITLNHNSKEKIITIEPITGYTYISQ